MTLEPEKNGSNQEETSTYDFQKMKFQGLNLY